MSADSLEIRIVKLESDVRRIDVTTQALAKLTELAERNEIAIRLLTATCATKEELQRVNTDVQRGIADMQRGVGDMHKGIADVHKEISAQGSRYTGWLLAVGGWVFAVAAMTVAAVRYWKP